MNDKLPIAALTYRINKLTRDFEDLNEKIELTLQNLNSEIALLKQSKANKPSYKVDVTEVDLKSLKNGRRTSKVCHERWAKWKEQLKSGMSISQIAHEWKCSRKAIYYAINKGFSPNCNVKKDPNLVE